MPGLKETKKSVSDERSDMCKGLESCERVAPLRVLQKASGLVSRVQGAGHDVKLKGRSE